MSYKVHLFPFLLAGFLGMGQVACISNNVATLKHLNDRSLVVEEQELNEVSQEQVLQSYHKYIDQAPSNHAMYNSALNRLADLEMIAGDDKLFSQAENEEQYQKAFVAEPADNEALGDENYKNAIDLYEGLLKTNPNDQRNEWVLYKLARAYESVGKLDQALSVLSRLVTEYPKSEYYVESQFRRGEISFTMNDFSTAENALLRVIQRDRSTVYYERALYKFAWAQFKQDRYDRALDSFFTLINTLPIVYDLQEKIDPRALSTVEKDMLDDIFRAVNLCFSYAGGVPYVAEYFSKTGKPRYEYEVFVRMGEYFVAHDRIQDAADIYGIFVKRNPFHPMSSGMQIERIDAYEKAKFRRSALLAREEFIQTFGVDTEFWHKQNSSTKEILTEQIKKILNELSGYYHARWQRRKQSKNFDSAVHWYEEYVKMFPQDEGTANKAFLLGELYSEKQLYEKAIVVYEKSAYDFAKHKDSEAAAYAVIDSYNKILKRKNTRLWRDKLASASSRFLENYSNMPQADAVRARLVEDLFALKRYDEAYEHAQIIIGQQKAARWVKVTAYIVSGHVAFDKQDYLQSQSHYNAALKLGIRNNRLKQEVNKKITAAAYQHAESLKRGGDLAGAAESFLALQKIAPKSDVSINALYDSATAYFKMQEWQKSIQLLLEFRNKYPEHKLVNEIPKKLIVAYEGTEQWENAADEMLILASKQQDQDFNRDATWQAAGYYEQAGKINKAIKAYKKYVYTYSTPYSLFIEGQQKLIDLYSQTGQLEKRRYWLGQVVKQYAKNKNKFDDRGKYIAANAAFVLASDELAQYKRTSLRLPLKRSLKKKNALLRSTVKAYEAVAQIGVAEFVTASTYHVAEVYQQLAQSIIKSQRPKQLSNEELEEYNLLLEEQAFPFEEKAIEIYEVNMARLKDGLYDNWIQQSLNQLALLQPARYQKNEVHDEVYSALE